MTGTIAILLFMISGLVLMFGARRRAIQIFLLAVVVAAVPGLIGQQGAVRLPQPAAGTAPSNEPLPQEPCTSQITELVEPLGARVAPGAGYFSPSYLEDQDRQHLGTDFPVPAGTQVYSPVTGAVVLNWTDRPDIMEAVLIVRDQSTGGEHVLGHIASPLARDAPVDRGDPIGVVRDWGRRSHLHWGVNSGSVLDAMRVAGWGWGRAPSSVTQEDAASLGWIDLNQLLASEC